MAVSVNFSFKHFWLGTARCFKNSLFSCLLCNSWLVLFIFSIFLIIVVIIIIFKTYFLPEITILSSSFIFTSL